MSCSLYEHCYVVYHECVFPWHINHRGYFNEILIIDNCTASYMDMYYLPGQLNVKFLPKNVINTNKPSAMGMASILKVGYKSIFIHNLLGIFYSSGSYTKISVLQHCHRTELRGVIRRKTTYFGLYQYVEGGLIWVCQEIY